MGLQNKWTFPDFSNLSNGAELFAANATMNANFNGVNSVRIFTTIIRHAFQQAFVYATCCSLVEYMDSCCFLLYCIVDVIHIKRPLICSSGWAWMHLWSMFWQLVTCSLQLFKGSIGDHLRTTWMRVIMGVAYGIQHMHELNPSITHPDLQSSAILLSEDGAAKIADTSVWQEVISTRKMPKNDEVVDHHEPISADPARKLRTS